MFPIYTHLLWQRDSICFEQLSRNDPHANFDRLSVGKI